MKKNVIKKACKKHKPNNIKNEDLDVFCNPTCEMIFYQTGEFPFCCTHKPYKKANLKLKKYYASKGVNVSKCEIGKGALKLYSLLMTNKIKKYEVYGMEYDKKQVPEIINAYHEMVHSLKDNEWELDKESVNFIMDSNRGTLEIQWRYA